MVADKLTTLKHGQRGDRSIDLSVTQPQAASLLNVSVPSVKRAMVAAKLAELEQGANQHRSIDLSSQAQAAGMVADKLTTLKHGQRADASIDASVTQDEAGGKEATSAWCAQLKFCRRRQNSTWLAT
jgi:hypothetical protein